MGTVSFGISKKIPFGWTAENGLTAKIGRIFIIDPPTGLSPVCISSIKGILGAVEGGRAEEGRGRDNEEEAEFKTVKGRQGVVGRDW